RPFPTRRSSDLLGLAFTNLLPQHERPSTRITLGTSTLNFRSSNPYGGGTKRLSNALLEQPCYNLLERKIFAMVQKSHPTTPIVEWLLFCAPYRQKLFPPTKPISEKCSYQGAQKAQNC